MAIATSLNPQDRLDWLRLIRTENVGPVTFYQLLRRYGSAAEALARLPDLARRGGRNTVRIWPRAEAERELIEIARAGARLIAWGEPDYPSLLAETEDAPPLITVKGDAELLNKRAIGIVGARNASAAGQRFAREIAWDLGRQGLAVVSGLARGIDAAAHGGSLDSGTVAVVAGGLDVVYPEENRRLRDDIAERGVIIAEMPVGTVPQARHFPRRNRLISGMSLGVLIIEAALKSGSLITARYAADQGRDVFAVPGSPLDPRCRGTNDLIRHGAILTESAEDVIHALAALVSKSLGESRSERSGHAPVADEEVIEQSRDRIVELLGPTAVPIDELVRQCHLSPSIVMTVLLELELAGRLDRHPGHRVSLR